MFGCLGPSTEKNVWSETRKHGSACQNNTPRANQNQITNQPRDIPSIKEYTSCAVRLQAFLLQTNIMWFLPWQQATLNPSYHPSGWTCLPLCETEFHSACHSGHLQMACAWKCNIKHVNWISVSLCSKWHIILLVYVELCDNAIIHENQGPHIFWLANMLLTFPLFVPIFPVLSMLHFLK